MKLSQGFLNRKKFLNGSTILKWIRRKWLLEKLVHLKLCTISGENFEPGKLWLCWVRPGSSNKNHIIRCQMFLKSWSEWKFSINMLFVSMGLGKELLSRKLMSTDMLGVTWNSHRKDSVNGLVLDYIFNKGKRPWHTVRFPRSWLWRKARSFAFCTGSAKGLGLAGGGGYY